MRTMGGLEAERQRIGWSLSRARQGRCEDDEDDEDDVDDDVEADDEDD